MSVGPSSAPDPSTGAASARPQVRRRGWRLFVAGVLVGALGVMALRSFINNTTLADKLVTPLMTRDTPGRADVIVVPGAAVNERCSLNLYGIRRVMFARQAFIEGRAPWMLFAGGRAPAAPCAVATAMADFAVTMGVPRDRVLVETASRSTWENAQLSHPILTRLGARRIVLVTDRLHMLRAERSFRHFGYQVERLSVPVSEAHRDNVSMLESGFRETIALAYYWAKGRLSDATVAHAAARRAGSSGDRAGATESTMTPPVKFPDGAVVVLGASYAKGWALSIQGRAVVNKGIEGQESWQLRERFESDVVSERPRAVVIWGFINDIFRSPRPKIDSTLVRTRESFTAMVAAARAQGIEPILATELTMTHPNTWKDSAITTIGWLLGKESYQDYVNGKVTTVNGWLREYARREQILLLDLQPAVSDASGQRRRSFATDDGSHIPPAGYEALSRYAEPVLSAHLTKP